MPNRVRCACRGNAGCKLCLGSGVYDYEPGPRGWMPFACPTCAGAREVAAGGAPQRCFTCSGTGTVDPANPPRDTSSRGLLRDMWRIFMGG
ncbi:MAG: hypothetical protein ACKODX_22000 [Gemmata sp.]